MNTENAIIIWPFEDAPKEYQALSPHGGDEDWLAVVPQLIYDTYYLGFLTDGTSFGVCDVSEHQIDGGMVLIGAHA